MVIPMRRSQSTLLMTVLVVLGLFFVSQLPAISNVGTTNPNMTEGARPPATDSDGTKSLMCMKICSANGLTSHLLTIVQ